MANVNTDQYAVDQPWARSADALLQEMSIDAKRGLEDKRVARQRRRHGANRLREAKRRSAAAILADQVKNLIILLLAVAAAVSFGFGQHLEALAILIAIILNVGIGFFTELRATRSMEALQRLGRVDARVRRGGHERIVAADRLVPGDIVLVNSGDVVGADLRLLEASRLAADESALTGESVPVDKQVEAVDAETPLAERSNMLFKGTALTRGAGAGVVVAVGMATELGRIASMASAAESQDTPLERRLQHLGYRLIWLTLAIAVMVTLIGLMADKDLLLLIETAIALAVAAAPEGLPMVATIGLARGVWRMLKHNALMSRLSAVETLGSTSVIFTDKTGTLTENRMTITRIAVAVTDPDDAQIFAVSPEADNGFKGPQGDVDPKQQGPLTELLEIGVLCNNAKLGEHAASSAEDTAETSGEDVGDPMEIALLEVGRRAGMEREALLSTLPEVREVAFERETQMMATVHADGDGCRVAVKGAPEAVLPVCAQLKTADGATDMGARQRQRWLDLGASFAEKGLRVLALAAKSGAREDADPYEGLGFCGLVGMQDPPRADVPAAVAACASAGIAVVMVTGDHPATAASIAAEVGIADGDSPEAAPKAAPEAAPEAAPKAVAGGELQRLSAGSEASLRKYLHSRVFARVSPKQKLDLISLHQKHGAVVAMTGDGVNDAPALKKADIGIAMGRRGTQVAKEAADMVLQDDAFGTIVTAVAQGRAIFANIRKFILFLLSGNVGEILIVGIAIMAGAPLPLLPLQILYLNMIGDVFPALALAAGDGNDTRMQAPPRDEKEALLTPRHWLAIGLYGGLIAASVLAAFWAALHPFGYDTSRAVTIAFLSLSFARLWHVFNMRSAHTGFVNNDIVRNPFVWGALVLCTGLLMMAIYLPGLPQILKLVRPTAFDWGLILGFSLLPLAGGQWLLTLINRD